jgi:hypothetical protein
MLAQFETTADPALAQEVALDGLILPADAAEIGQIVKMIDNLPPSAPADLVKGLADYRQGQFLNAADRLERAANTLDNTNSAAQARIVLAMARHKLGRSGSDPAVDDDYHFWGADWNEKMTTAEFAREAKQVLAQ